MAFLDDAVKKHPRLVYWNKEGSHFFISKPSSPKDHPLKKTLNDHFKHSNWDSLRRMLNLYNFQRCRNDGP